MITGEQVYLPSFTVGQKTFTLDGPEFRHLIKVRRFTVGDEIWVVNGQGTAAFARIDSINQDTVDFRVLQEEENRGELGGHLTLAIANLKGDHLNMVVEKATELGVHEIVPLYTDHTIKKGLNRERLERIAISAMKQCRRSRLPVVHDLTPFRDYVSANHKSLNFFCYAHESSGNMLANKRIGEFDARTVWIGPEGDWSKDEIDLASVSGYTFTGLGLRRLRAETAAIQAVGLLSALLQDPA